MTRNKISRLKMVKSKFPGIDWNKIRELDPSNNGKYLLWIGENYNYLSNENIKDILVRFERHKDKLKEKDIYCYSFSNLKKELDRVGFSGRELKDGGAITVFDDADVKVVLIEGEEAVKAYTAGTKWCISDFGTFFRYALGNDVFVAVCKGGPKIALLRDKTKRVTSFWSESDSNFPLKYLEELGNVLGKSLIDDKMQKILDACNNYKGRHNYLFQDPGENNPDKVMKIISMGYLEPYLSNMAIGDMIRFALKYLEIPEVYSFMADKTQRERAQRIWQCLLDLKTGKPDLSKLEDALIHELYTAI